MTLEEIMQIKGVGKATAEKFLSANYTGIYSIAVARPEKLSEDTGIGKDACVSITNKAKLLVTDKYETAKDLSKHKREYIHVCETIDNLFGWSPYEDLKEARGFEKECSYNIWSEAETGKTQCIMALAVYCYKSLKEKTVIINTEGKGKISIDRLVQIARANDIDPNKLLKNIIVFNTQSSDEMIYVIDQVNNLCEKGEKIGLIIVDSILGHLRAEYTGRSTLANRQQILNKILHALGRLKDKHNLCLVITSQVVCDPGVTFGSPFHMVGGTVLKHYALYNIKLWKSSEGRIRMIVNKSGHLEKGKECFFQITNKGIESAYAKKEKKKND